MPVMRLTYMGTDIDFQTEHGSTIPDDIKTTILTSKNGTLWIAQEYELGKWEPVLKTDKTDADNLNEWCKNRRACTLAPDQEGDPGTTYTVQMLNLQLPMQRTYDAGPIYEGQLILRETGP